MILGSLLGDAAFSHNNFLEYLENVVKVSTHDFISGSRRNSLSYYDTKSLGLYPLSRRLSRRRSPGRETTNRHLATAIETCGRLSFPVADHKTVTASTTITFPGIQIDSVAGTVSLPVEKFQVLRNMLVTWGQRKAASKHELLFLLGHLSHASTVLPPSRTFVRHLITAST